MVNLSPPVISLSSDANSPRELVLPVSANGEHVTILQGRAGGAAGALLAVGLIPIPHKSSSSSPTADSLYPLSDKNALGVSPLQLLLMDANLGSFSASAGIDIPLALGTANGTGRRVRSGSLFSTNSIWNDDNILMHSPLRTLTNSVLDVFHEGLAPGSNLGAFLSPNLGTLNPPLTLSNPTRNRSHTTSGSVHLGGMHGLDQSRLGTSPFLNAVLNDTSLLLDNLILNMPELPGQTRNRSQTYSGATPTIPEVPLMPGQIGVLPLHLHPQVSHRPLTHDMHPNANPQMDLPQYSHPFLQDDADFSELTITTNFENPSLGPTNTLLLDNVPHFVDAGKLFQLLNNANGMISGLHGRGILSVRVSSTNTSKMALVVCPSVEVSMNIKASFNHLELVPGVILYVAFAKLSDFPPRKLSRSPSARTSSVSGHLSNASSNGSLNSANKFVDAGATGFSDLIIGTVVRLSSHGIDVRKIRSLIKNAAKYPKASYQRNFGPLPDPIALRQFDSPKLRELRKTLENNERAMQGHHESNDDEDNKVMSQLELEELVLAMLDELPELCYDHIGNTIVQKIFTVLESPLIKLMMVKEIAPYLTQLGIHKNGTWAIQKIINLCQEDYQQKVLIAQSLKPYSVKLFNDQFGNYVLQCCLKFGSPFNDFIFETMLDNFLEISSGRFGARCIRTILETANDPKSSNSAVSNEQLYLIAALIVENAQSLVVNNNGSLLITWFLDTFNTNRSTEPDAKYALLCTKFIGSLEKLCTHKLANLTIFKMLNNRADLGVRQRIMDAIFGPFNEFEGDDLKPPSALLEAILLENQEHNAGPLFVYKILSNPTIMVMGDEASSRMYQQFVLNQVKRVLLEMNIVNVQPYKKLIDEVGLSNHRLNRTSSGSRKMKRGSNTSRHGKQSPHHQPVQGNQVASNQMPPGNYPANYSMYPQVGQPYEMGYANAPPMQNQFHRDMTVMQQLEQLSLSSAAMGYGSSPGTPSGGQRSMFF